MFKLIALLTAFIIIQNNPGKEIYTVKCVSCHGPNGTKGKWGAKNLQKSVLDDEQLLLIISDGKRLMPAWKQRLSAGQLLSVRDYVRSLRKSD